MKLVRPIITILSLIIVLCCVNSKGIMYNNTPPESKDDSVVIARCYEDEIYPIITPTSMKEKEKFNKLSDTYWIDISIEEQKITLYEGSKEIISGSVVTGYKYKYDTPKGRYKIYNLESGKILTGFNLDESQYESYVDYWMPFYKNYGIHDAQWRDSFGGDIYTYDGSHGCVNTEYDVVKTIFYYSDIGTIVYIH